MNTSSIECYEESKNFTAGTGWTNVFTISLPAGKSISGYSGGNMIYDAFNGFRFYNDTTSTVLEDQKVGTSRNYVRCGIYYTNNSSATETIYVQSQQRDGKKSNSYYIAYVIFDKPD